MIILLIWYYNESFAEEWSGYYLEHKNNFKESTPYYQKQKLERIFWWILWAKLLLKDFLFFSTLIGGLYLMVIFIFNRWF
jgi:hypothetical protein